MTPHSQAHTQDGAPPHSPSGFRRPAFWLGVVLLVGVALRLWYLAYVVDAPDFRALRQDMDVQDYHARAMFTGDWTLPAHAPADPEISSTPYYRPPGYPCFLAAVYALTGGSYLAPRLVNMVLGLLTAVLWFLLGRRVFNPWMGVLAAGLSVTYWGSVYYEGEVNDPALFLFLIPCIVWSLVWWAEGPGWRRATLTGILTGCYTLMRPNILAFGPVMALWMLHHLYWHGRMRRLAGSWAALLIGTLVFIAPVTVRNYVVSGEFVPISTYFGENLLIGNGPGSDGYTSWLPYLQELEGTGQFSVWVYPNIVRGLAGEIGDPALTHSEASDIFMKKALDYMAAHPARTLRLTLKKVLLFWSPVEITENKVVHYEKAHYPPLKYMPGFPMVLALLLFGLGALAHDAWRGRLAHPATPRMGPTQAQVVFLLVAFVAVYFGTFLPFFVNARARAPLYGVLLFLGAYGLWRLAAVVRRGAWARAAAGVLVLAVLYGLASVEWVPYTPDHARWHYARADSYLRSGRVDAAIAEAEAMLGLPGAPLPYMPFRLGHQFARENRHRMAVRLLQQARATDPESQHPAYTQDLTYHIAANLLELGRTQEALEAYEQARALNPEDPRVLNDLGVIAEDRGDLERAERHYRQAIRVAPKFALAHSNLGDLQARTGRIEAAIASFRRAAALAPENPDFHYNLGRLLARAGMVDAAIEQYRQTLAIVPDEARALNNLGMLLAGQGNAAQAAEHYRQAIASAPDFDLPYINLAELLARAGKHARGLAVLEKGLASNETSPKLHYALGRFLLEHGETTRAREHFEAALRLEPGHQRAQDALAALDKPRQ
ncbi:MAG: tetratricopeptide repeat protein [Candidatus Hydrogenedentota bacterium]